MWSAWHRTFTAFSLFTPGPLVLDEPTSDDLLYAMRCAEVHHCPTVIDGLKPITPDAFDSGAHVESLP
jgi:hypothetical protein